MRRVRELLAGCGLVAVVLACSGSTSSQGGSPTADQACADVAKARCTRIQTCSSLVFAVRYADEPTCEAREKANCVAALSAPSTGNTPAATEACATALNGNVDCAGFLANTPPAGCETKVGALANGAACAFNAQCQSTYCSVGPGTLCGTCTAQPAAGASCATEFCGQGLLCSGVSKTCGKPAAEGASCDPAPCAPGAACAGAVGKKTCQIVVSTAGPGQPCGLVSGSRVECADAGMCKFSPGQTSGVCLAAAADGAPCDDTNGPLCATPARCVSGTCQLPGATTCH